MAQSEPPDAQRGFICITIRVICHVGASCISLAPTFYAFGKKVRVRSFRCSSLAKLQPLALGCSLGLRRMTLNVISFAATFSLLEQTSLLTHSVAAPLKPGPADAGLRVCFLWFSLCDCAFYFTGNRKRHPLRSLAPPFSNRTRAMHCASIWLCVDLLTAASFLTAKYRGLPCGRASVFLHTIRGIRTRGLLETCRSHVSTRGGRKQLMAHPPSSFDAHAKKAAMEENDIEYRR